MVLIQEKLAYGADDTNDTEKDYVYPAAAALEAMTVSGKEGEDCSRNIENKFNNCDDIAC